MENQNIKINKTVARVADILDYIAKSHKPVGLAEISKELKIPKSSAFDIIHTLVSKKMLIINEENKTFQLDVKSFEIGSAYLGRSHIHSVARPYLKDLSLQTGETAFLAVPNNGFLVYLDKVEGRSPTRTTCVIGDRNYMHCTGLGKAMLASMPIEEVRMITGGGKLQTHTANTLPDFNSLIGDLEKIRERGYSIDNCEDNDFVFCVAAPILNHSGKCIAAISISTIYTPSTREKEPFYSKLITDAALEISHRFGYTEDLIYSVRSYNI